MNCDNIIIKAKRRRIYADILIRSIMRKECAITATIVLAAIRNHGSASIPNYMHVCYKTIINLLKRVFAKIVTSISIIRFVSNIA